MPAVGVVAAGVGARPAITGDTAAPGDALVEADAALLPSEVLLVESVGSAMHETICRMANKLNISAATRCIYRRIVGLVRN